MAVIKDVATYAGLSVAVVSKYLKNPDSVRQDTRERLEKAISVLNYKPSTAARALRTGRTGMLSIIMPDITNPFFAELFNVIRKEAAMQGYAVLLQTIGDEDRSPSIVSSEFAVSSIQRVDGVIVCFPDDEVFVSTLANQLGSIPMVLLGWRQMLSARSSILLDVCGGIYSATKYLVALGHKRIAYTGGPGSSVISAEKFRGYYEALKESVLTAFPEFIYHGCFAMETGYQAAKHFIADLNPPTAIVAENDILAIGCIKYCHKIKLSVPDEMAITGFDDIPLAAMYEPPITTAKPPLLQIGAAAVSQICNILADEKNYARHETEVFTTELIVRKSTDADYIESV